MSLYRLCIVSLICCGAWIAAADAFAYRKAVEGLQTVKGRLVTKRGRVELNGDFGLVMNQSYVNTLLAHGAINYYWNELWGISAEAILGLNSDKQERECIENFYNNPRQQAGDSCGPADGIPTDGNFGPAYVPIREINSMFLLNGIYNPVYGKQLLLLSSVVHFDMFLTLGGGIVLSDYYRKQQNTRTDGGGGGRPTRDPPQQITAEQTADQAGIGCEPEFANCYGIDGRPDPEAQTNVVASIGVGQKLHFGKSFNIKFELRNMTLLGTETGFENLFALWGGVGLRF